MLDVWTLLFSSRRKPVHSRKKSAIEYINVLASKTLSILIKSKLECMSIIFLIFQSTTKIKFPNEYFIYNYINKYIWYTSETIKGNVHVTVLILYWAVIMSDMDLSNVLKIRLGIKTNFVITMRKNLRILTAFNIDC